jgi:hypothetical protein
MTTDRDEADKLGPRSADYAVAALKGAAGSIPIVGNFLAELVGNIIPNQRIDRVERFLSSLTDPLQKAQQNASNLEDLKKDVATLLEISMPVAARMGDHYSADALARLVSERLEKKINFNEFFVAADILSNITTAEVALLFSFEGGIGFPSNEIIEDNELLRNNKSLLRIPRAYVGADESILMQDAVRESALQRLERFGLIEYKIERDTFGSGDRYERKFSHITILGRFILKQFGLRETLNPDEIFRKTSQNRHTKNKGN